MSPSPSVGLTPTAIRSTSCLGYSVLHDFSFLSTCCLLRAANYMLLLEGREGRIKQDRNRGFDGFSSQKQRVVEGPTNLQDS